MRASIIFISFPFSPLCTIRSICICANFKMPLGSFNQKKALHSYRSALKTLFSLKYRPQLLFISVLSENIVYLVRIFPDSGISLTISPGPHPHVGRPSACKRPNLCTQKIFCTQKSGRVISPAGFKNHTIYWVQFFPDSAVTAAKSIRKMIWHALALIAWEQPIHYEVSQQSPALDSHGRIPEQNVLPQKPAR